MQAEEKRSTKMPLPRAVVYPKQKVLDNYKCPAVINNFDWTNDEHVNVEQDSNLWPSIFSLFFAAMYCWTASSLEAARGCLRLLKARVYSIVLAAMLVESVHTSFAYCILVLARHKEKTN